MTQRNRVFVVDHMIALPFGHNLHSVNLFSQALAQHFSHVTRLGTNALPTYVEDGAEISRELTYPYNGLNEAKFINRFKKPGKLAIFGSFAIRLNTRLIHALLLKIFKHDLALNNTQKNWQAIFKKYKITGTDSLFFPSCDYYGVMSLIAHCRTLPEQQRPALHLRFIGHPESISYNGKNTQALLFDSIKTALRDGMKIDISAETPTYCQQLSNQFENDIHLLPYPVGHQYVPPRWNKQQMVLSLPGQGRWDKGFFRFLDIIKLLNQQDVGENFRLVLQNIKKSNRYFNKSYEHQLKKEKNVALKPARLSQQEINQMYIDADILLMPYYQPLYHIRGSAVFQEGLAIGRMVICTKGSAISDLVKRYGNGLVADDDDEFVEKILALSEMPKTDVERITKEALKRYQKDFNLGINKVVAALN